MSERDYKEMWEMDQEWKKDLERLRTEIDQLTKALEQIEGRGTRPCRGNCQGIAREALAKHAERMSQS